MSKIIFITGCSSGIGRDLAGRLADSGQTVIATARNVNSLSGLQVSLKLPLEVTSPESIRQAVETAIARFGHIDVLVNNAGYAVRGAVEEVPVSEAQAMFDANLFGVMRMVQAVAPHMRARKGGRIINISSISGRLVTPANGVYSASKFALEGLSDALRMELAPFGIQVVVVEPGSIRTRFHETVETKGRAIFTNPASPYRSLYEVYERVNAELRKSEPEPEAVSRVVEAVIAAERVKPRYLAGFPFPGGLVVTLRDQLWDRVVGQLFKLKVPMMAKGEQ